MKRSARIIVPVWGDYHVKRVFANIALPSLMAPGNLPFLSEHFSCEVMLLTQSRFVPYFESSPALQDLKAYCTVRFRMIDDLLGFSEYSVPLTMAFFRGLEDVRDGADPPTVVFFLNADFALADGAYRTVVEKIAQGERVILAPSLRVNADQIIPALEKCRSRDARVLAMAPRSMVRLALDHLHAVPRLKIVNRSFAHPSRMDQFYWFVDSDTLISFQYQMALVCLCPELAPPREIPCYIDYCAVPLLAPNTRKCVLSDSDQLFMMEVQGRVQRLEGEIRPGWPRIEEIARDVDGWTTQDQRDVAKELLRFHCNDLDDRAESICQEARDFMAQLTARLTEPARTYVNHPFWTSTFQQYMKEYTARQGQALPPAFESVVFVPVPIVRKERRPLALRVVRFVGHRLLGIAPEFTIAHPLWIYYRTTVKKIRQYSREAEHRVRAVLPKESVFKKMFAAVSESPVYEYDELSVGLKNLVAGIQSSPAANPEFLFIELPTLEGFKGTGIREAIQEHCAAGTRILYYVNDADAHLRVREGDTYASLIEALVPTRATGSVLFYGSFLSHVGRILTTRLIAAYYSHFKKPSFVLGGVVLGCLLPAVVVNNVIESRRYHGRPSRYMTSMLLDITLK